METSNGTGERLKPPRSSLVRRAVGLHRQPTENSLPPASLKEGGLVV